MRANPKSVATAFLISIFVLVLPACSSSSEGGESAPTQIPANPEAILESFYSTVAKINDLVRRIDADTDTYVSLGDRAQSQMASGDILGVAETLREGESISARSADMTQQQINLVDEALEGCLPRELIELLGLHRQEAEFMRDVFEAEARRDRLTAEALETGPGNPGVEQLALQAQEADSERLRLLDEAEEVEARRVRREGAVFALGVTPPRCD